MDNDIAIRIVTGLIIVIGIFTIPKVIVSLMVSICKPKLKEPE